MIQKKIRNHWCNDWRVLHELKTHCKLEPGFSKKGFSLKFSDSTFLKDIWFRTKKLTKFLGCYLNTIYIPQVWYENFHSLWKHLTTTIFLSSYSWKYIPAIVLQYNLTNTTSLRNTQYRKVRRPMCKNTLLSWPSTHKYVNLLFSPNNHNTSNNNNTNNSSLILLWHFTLIN